MIATLVLLRHLPGMTSLLVGVRFRSEGTDVDLFVRVKRRSNITHGSGCDRCIRAADYKLEGEGALSTSARLYLADSVVRNE